MGKRSLQATSEGIEKAELALTNKAWSREYLQEKVQCSRQPIVKFFSCKPIDRKLFVQICQVLDIDWQEVVGITVSSDASGSSSSIIASEVDVTVQRLRQHIQPYIQEKCGKMRVLDMEQPIGLGEIYTSVNILEKITGRAYREIAELTQDTDSENFDRFYLGNIREKRIPGMEAVEKFSKLMILGKPGAGKTTFLKHLAVQCIGGVFQAYRIPIFITLKDFAETGGKPDLLKYIEQWIRIDTQCFASLYKLLLEGKALVLLDGLDEVREIDSNRVLQHITSFSQQFSHNHFVITCRIAAREYTFEQFTEVEIADFDDEQIADFSNKWFNCNNDPIKAEKLLQSLKQDAPIRELASSPLLLTLLCLVFEDSGSFPNNRAELYQNGIDVLLKKWDVKRNIERDQVYKGLSLKRKQDLLSHIAKTTFDIGNYFFKQREIERYINQYIQNLPGASSSFEVLELDSTSVLKAIEAQHGLLVERARCIYSFSHLTFHEYFTARKIITSCNPYAEDDPILQELVGHITEKRWREVFLLTAGMLDSADALLGLMKHSIDNLLVNNEDFQEILRWINWQYKWTEDSQKSAALKLFYCNVTIALIERLDENPGFKFETYDSNELEYSNFNDVIGFDNIIDDATGLHINDIFSAINDLNLKNYMDDAIYYGTFIVREFTCNLIFNLAIEQAFSPVSDYNFDINRECFENFDELGYPFWDKINNFESQLWEKIKDINAERIVEISQATFQERIEIIKSEVQSIYFSNALDKFWKKLIENKNFWRLICRSYDPYEPDLFLHKFYELFTSKISVWWKQVSESSAVKLERISHWKEIFIDYDICQDISNIFDKCEEERLNDFEQWWEETKPIWIEYLRSLTIEHRHIGYNWHFGDTQKQLLRQYYNTSKLLIDCLNSDCYISREVRQEIEETLLLPVGEIEKYKQQRAGSSS